MNTSDFQHTWKLKSITRSGGSVTTSETHLVVYPEFLWRYIPGHIYEEGDEIGNAYSLTWENGMGFLKVHTAYENSFCYFITVNGNSLRMKLGSVFGNFPRDNSQEHDGSSIYLYEKETDPEVLEKLSRLPELAPAIAVEHAILGRLVYNSNLEWWKTELTAGALEGASLFIPDEEKTLLTDSSRLDSISQSLDQLDLPKIKAFASERLLDLKNGYWLDEDEKPLTQSAFAARLIQVESIEWNKDNSISIAFDDNDLFWGHGIHVEIDPSGNCTGAEMY